MRRSDTIVAAATPPGRGGVGIVRISGPKVPELAAVMLGELPKARHATFARFLDAQKEPIDAGLALFFPAPHSYTGEHVLELHGHGGPQSAGQGRLRREGMTVVIAGRPNAGKSSLLNRLAGYDAAIVTAIPGTTRDVVRERIHLDGMPLHVLDTAGLRDGGDVVEEEGIRRAQAEMHRADLVLFVIDAVEDPSAAAFHEERARLPAHVPVTLVFNKCDLAVGLPVAD